MYIEHVLKSLKNAVYSIGGNEIKINPSLAEGDNTEVQVACAKFTRVYNLHTCKYTPGMYFCACERKYTRELIYIRVN